MSADILLATYQGEKYLKEQIESLFSQSYSDIRIIARDDGSTDCTTDILNEYASRITILPNKANSGIRNNFSELLQQHTADYVFFSDQDDVWLPNKVGDTIRELQKMEKRFGKSTPLLVHADLKVVDKDLSLISPSFWSYAKLNPLHNTLNRLLVQNNITGCTIGMNRALAGMVIPIPEGAIMHDWWIALVASCFGQISYIPSATMLYRQHQSNDIGAKKNTFNAFVSQSKEELIKKSQCQQQTYEQANQFLESFKFKMYPDAVRTVQAYIELKEQSYLKQKRTLVKHQFFKHGFFRNLKFFFGTGK